MAADNNQVKLVSLNRTATFTVEISEHAVAALKMINEFGVGSLQKAVSQLSPREAEEHSDGLKDLVTLGGVCAAALKRLSDARDVIAGRKVAKDREQS